MKAITPQPLPEPSALKKLSASAARQLLVDTYAVASNNMKHLITASLNKTEAEAKSVKREQLLSSTVQARTKLDKNLQDAHAELASMREANKRLRLKIASLQGVAMPEPGPKTITPTDNLEI